MYYVLITEIIFLILKQFCYINVQWLTSFWFWIITLHLVTTINCNWHHSSFWFWNVPTDYLSDPLSWQAYGSGCDIVILASDFQRTQIIPGEKHGNIQVGCIDCSSENGRVCALIYINVCGKETEYRERIERSGIVCFAHSSQCIQVCNMHEISQRIRWFPWGGGGGRKKDFFFFFFFFFFFSPVFFFFLNQKIDSRMH